MNKINSNSICILFKDYNNFVIPYEEKDNKKILLLNGTHADLTDDLQLYDESLKIIYYFDTKDFTVRREYSERVALNDPKLEKFLIEELQKYSLPNQNTHKIKQKYNYKYTVIVEDYHLPDVKQPKGDFKKRKEYAEKIISTLLEIGGVEALNFAQNDIKNAFDNIPNGLSKNLSDYLICKMAVDAAKPIAEFVADESINEKRIYYVADSYYVNFLLKKERIN